MKKTIVFLSLFLLFFSASAEKYPFDQVELLGVENPVYISLSDDGLRMIIIDQQKGLIKVKQCYRPYLESKWGAATEVNPINDKIGEDTRIGGLSYSWDNKFLFFAANFDDTFGGMDIYYCNILENGWSNPQNIGEPINSAADENYPSITGNNRSFYFTREIDIKKLSNFRTGQLYHSVKDSESEKWSDPEKLNNQINDGGLAYVKAYDDNKTIIYSQVKDSKDGWKIYWTKRLNDLHWYIPTRLDTLISKHHEIAPSFCKQDGFLYFIKYDDSGFNAEGEVYKHKLEKTFKSEKTIKVSGRVINPDNNSPLVATVLVTDPVLGRIQYLTNSETNGQYKTLLNAGREYMFHVWKDGDSHQYKFLNQTETNNDINLDFKLFDKVELALNIYDKEELWPLDGKVKITDAEGKELAVDVKAGRKGQKRFTLPIGQKYKVNVEMKDYQSNTLELNLAEIVLFDEFIRDIELLRDKRELEIYVTDITSSDPLNAKVDVVDSRGRTFNPKVLKGVIGLSEITLREGESFDVEVRGPKGFAFKHTSINLDVDRNLDRLHIELQPLMRKVPIRLNNINFETNSSDLMEMSYTELDRVVILLKENPEIYAEIMAHTDDIGSDKYNNVLADKRARSVVEYLVINGIESKRLIARGYGETMPVVPNDSEENRALNRRVEMKILDENDEDFYIEERVIEE